MTRLGFQIPNFDYPGLTRADAWKATAVSAKAAEDAGFDTVLVNNSGNYFTNDGPPSEIFGTAVPVDSSNARLNVSFTGSNGNEGLGNYWIVDLDADYQWAIVSDPTGNSCFILSRTKFISPELKADLLARAAAKGVNIGNVTDTPQF